jgi:hypothetical protein
MNMFAKSNSSSIEEYLNNIPSDRRPTVDFLNDFIQKSAPSLKPFFAYNMLGYGKLKYLDKRTKETKEWPIVSLANQKNYISIYICAVENGEYLAEKYKSKLGRVDVGKSCIRLKKLEDLNLDALKDLIRAAPSNIGMIGAQIIN